MYCDSLRSDDLVDRVDDRGDIVMSKYYKAEDVINTLADQWRFEQEMESPYPTEDIEEWKKVARELFADIPIIESEEVVCKFDEDQMKEIVSTALEEVIVRCEDCTFAKPTNTENAIQCTWLSGYTFRKDHYCSAGERMEE